MRPRGEGGGRRGRRVVLALAALVFGGLGVSSTVDLLDAAGSLEEAERQIDLADAAIRDGRIGDAEAALGRSERMLHSANEQLRLSPALVLARRVPLLGENLQSLDRSVEIAGVVVHGGRQILATSETLQDDSGDLAVELREGAIPAAEVERATTEIESLVVALTGRTEPPSSPFVLPQIRSIERRVYDEAGVQHENLLRLRRGMIVLQQLVGVDRPRRTLIAVANTAEMRGAGGMMLNYGVLEADGGQAEIEEFGRVEELRVVPPPDPEAIDVPGDFQERWSAFDYTRDWRNATLAADFRIDAPILLEMYRTATSLRADAVIQVDPDALSALLAVTGPVDVEELGTVTAENVAPLVLNEAYFLYPDVEQRSDVLGNVAEAAFRALVSGTYSSVADLADALGGAVDERHLMMYSADPSVQAALEFFDATGSLPDPGSGDQLHLTVQNMAGNKLDYYVSTGLTVSGTRDPGKLGEVRATVTVRNDAPVGQEEPGYIFGSPIEGRAPGAYRAAVSLYLPAGTSLVGSSGGPFEIAPTALTEGGRPVVTYWIDVPSGGAHTAELDLRLAPIERADDYSLTLLPSPRVRPTRVDVDLAIGDDVIGGEFDLDVGRVLTRDGERSLAGF